MSANGRRKGSHELLVMALASGATYARAAELAGVSERTVRRRVEDPEVVAEVQRQRDDLVQRASGQLTGSLDPAIQTLRALLDAEGASIRLRAASTLLSHAIKLHEVEQLQRRIAAIEATVAHSDPWGVSVPCR